MANLKHIFIALCLIFAISSCGYQNSASQPNVLNNDFKEIAIDKVENPTLKRWINPAIRNQLRDEITNRNQLTWVDKSKAESLITIRILSLSDGTRVEGDKDKSLKYDMKLRAQMVIKNASDGNILWNSGTVTVTQSYFKGEELTTDKELVTLMVRRLVDRMNQAY